MKKFILITLLLGFTSFGFAQALFFIERGDTIHLTPVRTLRAGESLNADDWFTTQHGQRVRIGEGIIVELREGALADEVFSFYDIWDFERLSDNIYLVIPREESVQFELSRTLLQNSDVVHSHPNLIRERQRR